MVVPSPATSSAFLATSLTSEAPMFFEGLRAQISSSDRHTVVRNGWCAPTFGEHDIAAFGAKRDANRIRKLVHTGLKLVAGFFVERDLL